MKFMKVYRFLTIFITICLAVGTQMAYGAASSASSYSLSRYSVIMERAPFGPLPKKLTPEELAAAEAAAAEEAAGVVEEEAIPPSFEQIKVTALTMFGGKPAAGFTDGAKNKSYYLREGEEFEGYSLVDVDFDGMEITLRQNAIEAVLPLWINPATTNCADISSFGVTDPSAMAATPVSAKAAEAPAVNKNNSAKSVEDLERERRRAEWRKKRDEEREQRRKELEAMTPEEREQHLRQVNMDLIRSGDGPPLPIELNQEEMEQLASEGFAVPGINVPMPEGAEANEGLHPRGRRGRWRNRPAGGPPTPQGAPAD